MGQLMGSRYGKLQPEVVRRGRPPPTRQAMSRDLNSSGTLPEDTILRKENFMARPMPSFDITSSQIMLANQYRFLAAFGMRCQVGRLSRAIRIKGEDTLATPSQLVDIHAVEIEKHVVCAHFREIALLKKLSHANLISYVDFLHHADNNILYVIAPWYERTLQDTVMDYRVIDFSVSRANSIVLQLVQGIHFLRSKGIVHQNFSPWNIYVDVGDHVIIGGFLLSWNWSTEYEKAQRGNRSIKKSERKHMLTTQTNLPFMAPETIKTWLTTSLNDGEFVDLWSLGSLIVFVHTGWPPFGSLENLSPDKLIHRILRSKPDLSFFDPRSVERGIAKGLLQKKPTRRISIENVMSALRDVNTDELRTVTEDYVFTNETTSNDESSAVKPVSAPTSYCLTCKQRSDAALNVGRIARGSVTRMRIKQWQDTESGEKTNSNVYKGSMERTASVPAMNLNRKKRPLLRLGTSDDDLLDLIEGVQVISPKSDELMKRVANYKTVQVKLGKWSATREILKGSIDARVRVPDLDLWGPEKSAKEMNNEFCGPLPRSYWLVRDHILVLGSVTEREKSEKTSIHSELQALKKIGITRIFALLDPGKDTTSHMQYKSNLAKAWKSKKTVGMGIKHATEESKYVAPKSIVTPLSSPQSLKRAASFGIGHSLKSPKLIIPTFIQRPLQSDDDIRITVDSILESLILGEVTVILQAPESTIAHVVASILLGRLYSFNCEVSMQYVCRLQRTMHIAGDRDNSQRSKLLQVDKEIVDRILQEEHSESQHSS